MTRAQRRQHAWTWLALGPLIALGLIAALLARPPIPVSSADGSTNTPIAPSSQPAATMESRP